MTDEEARNSQYWEERSEELSNEELKGVSGGIGSVPFELKSNDPKGSGSGKTLKEWEKGNKTGVVVLGSSD